MKNQACCFSGHRDIPYNNKNKIKRLLKKEITKLIKAGVKIFYSGGALGFDTYAAQMVLSMKEKYKEIKLIMVYPCKDQTKNWSVDSIKEYNKIIALADEHIFLQEHYTQGCMHKRNRYMVDNSVYCICYLNKVSGGTAYTVDYAKRKGLTVINLD